MGARVDSWPGARAVRVHQCVGLARRYCRRSFEAVRFGLRQEYSAHDELLPILRGKVD